MADISKINSVDINTVSKVNGVNKSSIASINGANPSNYLTVYATIDSGSVDAELTDFPVGISLDATDTILSGLGGTDYEGFHFLVNSVECYAEIDIWDMVSEKATVWVKVPTVSSSSDTVITVQNRGDDNTAYVGATGSTPAKAVWDSSFEGVWHMSQDPTGGAGSILDSTAHIRHATPINSPTSIASILGKGLACGNNPNPRHAQTATLDLSAIESAFTMECHHNYQAVPGTYYDTVLHIGFAQNGTPLINRRNTDQKLGCAVWGAGSYSATYNAPYLDWGHVALTNSSGSIELVVDGVPDISDSVTISDLSSAPVTIGNGYNLTFANVAVYVSESRISSIVRSDAWLKATAVNLAGNLVSTSL